MFKIKVLSYGRWLRLRGKFELRAGAEQHANRNYPNALWVVYKARAVRRVPLVRTDGGRSIAGETRDCTVRALAVTTPLTYAEAHQLFEKHGRRFCDGVTNYVVRKVLAELPARGIECTPVFDWFRTDDPRPTLGQFIAQHPRGNYYITLNKHAVGLIDGVTHDNATIGLRSRVELAFRLTVQ